MVTRSLGAKVSALQKKPAKGNRSDGLEGRLCLPCSAMSSLLFPGRNKLFGEATNSIGRKEMVHGLFLGRRDFVWTICQYERTALWALQGRRTLPLSERSKKDRGRMGEGGKKRREKRRPSRMGANAETRTAPRPPVPRQNQL